MATRWIIYLVLCAWCIGQVTCDGDEKIVQVLTLIRHGARSGNSNLLKTELVEKVGTGKLTGNGHRMVYELGTKIKNQYPDIFNDYFQSDQITVYTSSSGRCMQSASSFLMGLMPLESGPEITLKNATSSKYFRPPIAGFDSQLDEEFALPKGFQTVSVISAPYSLDMLFQPWIQYVCPGYGGEALESYYASVEKYSHLAREASDKLKAIGIDANEILKKDYFSLSEIGFIYDEIVSYKYYMGKEYPGVQDKSLIDHLKRLSAFEFNFWFPSLDFTKFFTDSMSRSILKFMKAKKEARYSPKFVLYSGHDINVYAYMLLFNLTSQECHLESVKSGTLNCEDHPGFASSITFELIKQKSEYFVKVLYNGRVIPLCKKDKCSFAEFENVMEGLFYDPKTKLSKCGNSMFEIASPKIIEERVRELSTWKVIVLLLMATTIMILIVMLLYYYWCFTKQTALMDTKDQLDYTSM